MQAGEAGLRPHGARGIAVLTVVLVMTLASLLALALVLITTIETRAAFNFRGSGEASHAADAGIELALADLAVAADWSAVLDGSSGSSFVDGSPGRRTLPDGQSLDLAGVVNLATCGHAAVCAPSEMDAVTGARPWGPNNPRWRLYMHGPLGSMAPGRILRSSGYVVVLVGDDPSETDNDPLRDGVAGLNPGAGALLLRSEAFGASGAHKVIEATVVRPGIQSGATAGVRLVAWREVREAGL
jgi:hypothetical protein